VQIDVASLDASSAHRGIITSTLDGGCWSDKTGSALVMGLESDCLLCTRSAFSSLHTMFSAPGQHVRRNSRRRLLPVGKSKVMGEPLILSGHQADRNAPNHGVLRDTKKFLAVS